MKKNNTKYKTHPREKWDTAIIQLAWIQVGARKVTAKSNLDTFFTKDDWKGNHGVENNVFIEKSS